MINDNNPIGEYTIYGKVNVIIKEPFGNNIDLNKVLLALQQRIPEHFVQDLEAIYVGQFSHLDEKDLEAVYEDGAIYVSNEQDSVNDLLSDLIHETSHVVEETYGMDIYGDGKIEHEFLMKRRTLLNILKQEGYNVDKYNFYETEYDEEFDLFLYEEVTYQVLTNLTIGLFVSPYGATCLREYWGNAYEDVFTGNAETVREISPEVYRKIEDLTGVN